MANGADRLIRAGSGAASVRLNIEICAAGITVIPVAGLVVFQFFCRVCAVGHCYGRSSVGRLSVVCRFRGLCDNRDDRSALGICGDNKRTVCYSLLAACAYNVGELRRRQVGKRRVVGVADSCAYGHCCAGYRRRRSCRYDNGRNSRVDRQRDVLRDKVRGSVVAVNA